MLRSSIVYNNISPAVSISRDNINTKTIPIIIGALGTINKSTEKYIEEIPGECSIYELQKTAVLGTANILRKALSLNIQ